MQRYTNNVTLQTLTIDFSGRNHFLFSSCRIDDEKVCAMMLHWVECIHVDMKTSKVGEMRNPTIPTCEDYWIHTAKRCFVNNKKTQINKKKFYKHPFITAIFWSNLLLACKYRSFGEVSHCIDYQYNTNKGRLNSIILPAILHEITAFFAAINMQ